MVKFIIFGIFVVSVAFAFITLLPIIHELSRCNEAAFHKSIFSQSSITSRTTRRQCEESYAAINKLESCYEEVISEETLPGSVEMLISLNEYGMSDYRSVEEEKTSHNSKCRGYHHVIFK